jgi:hypothetical protein
MDEFVKDGAMEDIGFVRYKKSNVAANLEYFTECLRKRTKA